MVIDPTYLGATIVVAQALSLKPDHLQPIPDAENLVINGNKASICV